MAQGGWSKKLEPQIKMRLPELASAMQAGYDASGIGRRSGKLRAALGTLANYKASARSIRIDIGLPYARIQDVGGQIPTRYPRRARAMRFIGNDGSIVFAKRARGFTLPGFKYASVHGVDAIRQRMSNMFQVSWK